MSHFTCMVIGNDPEGQLAPYNENIRTTPKDMGEVPQDEIDSMIKYYKEPKNGEIDLPFDKLYKKKGTDWNGDVWKKVKGKWRKFSDSNPDSKWDWYELGGRWSGYLRLKEMTYDEVTTDSALKKEIDFERMKNIAEDKAAELYDRVMKVIGHLPINESWESIRRKYTNGDSDYSKLDLARDEYGSQPRVKAYNEAKEFALFSSPDDFDIPREQYLQNARNEAISTFAVLKDGVWYEKGEMGWCGITSNEKDQNEWNKQIMELLESVSDDTLISIYDCHI